MQPTPKVFASRLASLRHAFDVDRALARLDDRFEFRFPI